MENQDVQFVKNLPLCLLSSEFTEIKYIFERIILLLSDNNGVSKILISVLCKTLPSLLQIYQCNKSFYFVKNVIRALASLDPKYCCENLIPRLDEFATTKKTYNVTNNIAQSCLHALEWTLIVIKYGWKYFMESNGANLSKVINVQSKLTFCIASAGSKQKTRKAMNMMDIIWSKTEVSSMYGEHLLVVEPSQDIVVLGSYYVFFLSKNSRTFDKYKIAMLEIFMKTVIAGKLRPNINIVEACDEFFKMIDDKEFQTIVLPGISKALLRNPEIIMECVASFIYLLSLDISAYALEIGKKFAVNFCSKEEKIRDEAIDGCFKIASRCGKHIGIESMVKHLFNVYYGSDGQLSLASQKISVLQGIASLSNNKVSSSDRRSLTETLSTGIFRILDAEVNEKILVHALEVLNSWFQMLPSDVSLSNQVISYFQKKLSSKSVTSSLKVAYFRTLKTYFKNQRLSKGAEFIPLLIQSIEKASNQPLVLTVVTEGLCAAYFVVKFADFSSDMEVRLNPALDILSDTKKQIFVSDRILSQASDEMLLEIVSLCSFVIMKYDKDIASDSPFYKALIYCAVSSNLKVRNDSLCAIKKLSASNKAADVIANLLNEFLKILDIVKIKDDSEERNLVNGETIGITLNIYAAKTTLKNVLLSICCSDKPHVSDLSIISFGSLIVSHHPKLGRSDIWINVLNKLGIKPSDLIRNNEKKIVKMLVDGYDGSQCMENALSTVLSIQPEALLPSIIKQVTQLLESKDLLLVTREELEIYLTPVGELYNKSILIKKESAETIEKNIKRESKLYSFKEQQEELELKKELEEKKKKALKAKEPELTEKQKEIFNSELEKENEIRNKIVALKCRLKNVMSMLRAAIKGSPQYLSIRFRIIVPLVLQNLQSIFASSDLCDLYIRLRFCVFPATDETDTFGIFIAYLILRYQKPQCSLNKEWTEEDLNKASVRAIQTLLTSDLLSAPGFAYCFPFIYSVMLSSEADINILQNCLQIISKYSGIRGKKLKKFNSPKLLPRQQMFELLIKIISSTGGGSLQLSAVNTFLDVAMSCSNEDGCDPCTTEEINTLLQGLMHNDAAVREIVLKALLIISSAFPSAKKDFQVHLRITKRIWRSKFDIVNENRLIADTVWENAAFDQKLNGLADSLFEDVIFPVVSIQEAAASALADLMKQSPDNVQGITKKLINTYHESNFLVPAEMNELGHIVKSATDSWESRRGVALALQELAPYIRPEMLPTVINFYVQHGIQDRNEFVAHNILQAGIALINQQDKENTTKLLPIFEKFLKKTSSSSESDTARAAVIVLMGTLACHLDPTDPKVKSILNKLTDSLSTPSQQVQEAIANCIPPLIILFKDDAPAIQKKLMHRLLNANSYGERKGAAYGVAAVVKGVGIMYMKQLEVMTTLTNAIQDKKNYKHREGALFGFEKLSCMLGRLFEPYIVHVLPHLLVCYGDNSQYVRTATEECARIVMSKLSAHGVKLILPSLLQALDDDSWRTKAGSVELLGNMAYCAPKQLSSCLPSVVPKLIEVLRDSHIKVQEAGAQALKVIGSVIRNPEIQAMVGYLLGALQDPSNKIAPCLHALLDTKFVHFIDAASLALIMPVVQRAFVDRSTETRKMAAQIIGNMYSLTDEKDLSPYLPSVLPGLKNSLLDSVPEIRAVSAKALGAMIRGLGESSFEDLLPWLMRTLISENSAVDRSGAAQGISEVVGGMGLDKLHKFMPEIITTAGRTDLAPNVKDGYLMMFIYMPNVFGDDFTPYIGQIIVPILKALADETEYVRDTALKAGQRVVSMYAESAIQLLLPELEKGIFDDNWRIRLSSVQLLGDLLYRISGVTGKMSTETAHEDDNFGTEHSHKVIINILGEERRNRVLAGLYICRSDVSVAVRQAALHVWKVVVTNTPKTLREILKTLFGLLLNSLASGNDDKRQVAARTLGDLVRKLGERILPEIIPLLENGLKSDDVHRRKGVCVGLSEIIRSTSRDMVIAFRDNLIPTIKKTLCDPLPEVRQAAGRTFDSFYTSVGSSALEEILPYMLTQLKDDDPVISEIALDGLREVMLIKSRVVLPYLMPTLIAPPINVKVMSVLASAAGDTLTKYLYKILPTLLKIISTSEEKHDLTYCQAVILSINDEVGIRIVMENLHEVTKSDNIVSRKAAIFLLSSLCTQSKANYISFVPQLLRIFICLLAQPDNEILESSLEAIRCVLKNVPVDKLWSLVPDVRSALKQATTEIKDGGNHLPGLCVRRGIVVFVPVFREGMFSGNSEIKEQAAVGFGELIRLTSADSLKLSMVVVIGPLIRVFGERLTPIAKAAVIETLTLILERGGALLKQFLPQLQTTFLKSLCEIEPEVQLKSAIALYHLIMIIGKADALFAELYGILKSHEEPEIVNVASYTIRLITVPTGDTMNDQLRRSLYIYLRDSIDHPEESSRLALASCLGCLTKWLSLGQLDVLLTEHILVDDNNVDTTLRHGRSTVLFVALKEVPSHIYTVKYIDKINKTILSHLQSNKVSIVMNGIRSCCYLFLYLMKTNETIPERLLTAFNKTSSHSNSDVKQYISKVCMYIGQRDIELADDFLQSVVSLLVAGVKESNTIIKSNCELALISVLRITEENRSINEKYQKSLDASTWKNLNELLPKMLGKVSMQIVIKEIEIDVTLLV